MSTNKRKEPFRYTFFKPPQCFFQISEINGMALPSKQAQSFLLDLNKSGCKMKCGLDLKATENRIKLKITLDLIEEPLTLSGMIKWQQSNEGSYTYGIQFELSSVHKERILQELRNLPSVYKIIAV